jgi:hypothetical protein
VARSYEKNQPYFIREVRLSILPILYNRKGQLDYTSNCFAEEKEDQEDEETKETQRAIKGLAVSCEQ